MESFVTPKLFVFKYNFIKILYSIIFIDFYAFGFIELDSLHVVLLACPDFSVFSLRRKLLFSTRFLILKNGPNVIPFTPSLSALDNIPAILGGHVPSACSASKSSVGGDSSLWDT